MAEIKEALADAVRNATKQPLMALLLIIFLVQSWIMVIKLDNVTNALIAIHKDNVTVQEYIREENNNSDKYETKEAMLVEKINMIYELVRK